MHCRHRSNRCKSGPAYKGKLAGVKHKKMAARATPPTAPLIVVATAAPRMPNNDYAPSTSNVFGKMGASDIFHDATTKFVHLLDANTVDIDQASIGDYCYNELGGGVC
ncbi:putative galacturonosyltransferase 14 [Hordeum vulgare]|nr:putative galacturonosyltransferase 14 [Hordeum vulgare]